MWRAAIGCTNFHTDADSHRCQLLPIGRSWHRYKFVYFAVGICFSSGGIWKSERTLEWTYLAGVRPDSHRCQLLHSEFVQISKLRPKLRRSHTDASSDRKIDRYELSHLISLEPSVWVDLYCGRSWVFWSTWSHMRAELSFLINMEPYDNCFHDSFIRRGLFIIITIIVIFIIITIII